jgi:hypothetical protein
MFTHIMIIVATIEDQKAHFGRRTFLEGMVCARKKKSRLCGAAKKIPSLCTVRAYSEILGRTPPYAVKSQSVVNIANKENILLVALCVSLRYTTNAKKRFMTAAITRSMSSSECAYRSGVRADMFMP